MEKLNFKILMVMFLLQIFCPFSLFANDITADIKLEADYILLSQFVSDSSNAAYGAINNVYGDPTWVVPGENAVAIMGLSKAASILNDNSYIDRANLAADYLVRMQDADGAWFDQYDYSTVVNNAKSLRHTAEVMMAFDELGFNEDRYDSMMNAANFILNCQDVSNKGGLDDGLVSGGKDSLGNYNSWRWTSDNAYAYQALEAAANWSSKHGQVDESINLKNAADRILEGLNSKLFNGSDHWARVIDSSGNIVASEDRSDWISYAPIMLDLPLDNVNLEDVGDWINQTLQKSDGAVIWDDESFSDRKSPGYSFQAMLVWLDNNQAYASEALDWAETSGLWQKIADYRGVSGGWIDWEENGVTPDVWQRFIDTSAYYIMVKGGGYDFSPNVVPEPASLLLFGIGGLYLGLAGIMKKK